MVVVTSPASSPPVSGRGSHQDCVCPLLVLPLQRLFQVCGDPLPWLERTQRLEEVAESWELQPEAREDENRPRADKSNIASYSMNCVLVRDRGVF